MQSRNLIFSRNRAGRNTFNRISKVYWFTLSCFWNNPFHVPLSKELLFECCCCLQRRKINSYWCSSILNTKLVTHMWSSPTKQIIWHCWPQSLMLFHQNYQISGRLTPRFGLQPSRNVVRSTKYHPIENEIWSCCARSSNPICLRGTWNNSTTTEIQKRVCPSKRQWLQPLLHIDVLGDWKPSRLLWHTLKLCRGTVADAATDKIFPELYLQKLPLTIRMTLAVHKYTSLSELADMANNMAIWKTLQSPPLVGEQQRSHPQPDICWQKLSAISTDEKNSDVGQTRCDYYWGTYFFSFQW